MPRVERAIERLIFRSRWLLAPFYIGLIIALVVLLVQFAFDIGHMLPTLRDPESRPTILAILNLVDLSLVANLVLIVIFSGYESFVSRIDTGSDKRPAWMGKIDFSGLKVKLMGSLAAISGIYLLEALLNLDSQSRSDLVWKIGIHVTFVVSGVLFALTEFIQSRAEGGAADGTHE